MNTLRALKIKSPVQAELNGEPLFLFCSNDYLGLSFDPELHERYKTALEASGLGSGAARLISGTRPEHIEFEKKIAHFLKKESALLFSSGYLANLGVLSSFLGSEDLIVMDKLSHASLIDAAKLSGAHLRIFPHRNMERAEEILIHEKDRKKKVIVTDSVFSMDGDLAPLKELVDLKNKHEAILILDEAHGLGVYGEKGRGAAEAARLLDQVDIFIATLSKAFGQIGGIVAGDKLLIDFLINRARVFIYDTALPPAIPQTCSHALEKIQHSNLRDKLWENVRTVRGLLTELGFQISEEPSPIIPIIVGSEERALTFSKKLLENKIFIPAIRYPTVGKGKARLRLTVSAAHGPQEINLLKKSLEALR